MFFTLSGFVITHVLVEELAATGKLRLSRFYARRAGRLLPALIALCLVLGLAGIVREADMGLLLKTIGWCMAYLLNWALILGFPIHGALSHTWSLSVEEQFYLVWPLLIVLIKPIPSRARRFIAVGGVFALAVGVARFLLQERGATIPRLYNGSDFRLDALVLGAILSIWGRLRKWHFPPWLPWIGSGALLLYLVSVPWGQAYSSRHLYAGGLTVVAVGTAGGIIFALTPSSLPARILRLPPIRWMGKISYSLYLWHYPVILVFPTHPWVALLTTLLAATVSFYLVESPVREWVRTLTPLNPDER